MGSMDGLTPLMPPSGTGTRFRQKREREPGQLCCPLGSKRGCWVGLGSAAGGIPVTSDGPLVTGTALSAH